MSKPPATEASADESYWKLVDDRARLMSERVALVHADGRPRGLAVFGWESPARRRATLLAAEIDETNDRFERARARYAAAMRHQSAAQARAVRAEFDTQATALAARPSSEFAAQRVQTRAAAMSFDDAGALKALDQKMQSAGGGKR